MGSLQTKLVLDLLLRDLHEHICRYFSILHIEKEGDICALQYICAYVLYLVRLNIAPAITSQ